MIPDGEKKKNTSLVRPQRPRRRFKELSSAQQAAVIHGLKMEPSTWDDFARPKELAAAPTVPGSLLGSSLSSRHHLRNGPKGLRKERF